MSRLLHRLPFSSVTEEVAVRGERVRVRGFQIIVWVSVTPDDLTGWEPALPRLPAILDTGHNHDFSIQRRHLLRWAGLSPERLASVGAIRDRGKRIPLLAADLWLHRNRPDSREPAEDHEPYRLNLPQGIAVYPDADDFPRLPLLGLRALVQNELRRTIDGRGRCVGLRTPRRWWPWG